MLSPRRAIKLRKSRISLVVTGGACCPIGRDLDDCQMVPDRIRCPTGADWHCRLIGPIALITDCPGLDGCPDCARSCFAKWPLDCDLIISLPDCARLLAPDRCQIVF